MKAIVLLSLLVFTFASKVQISPVPDEIGHCEIRGTANDPAIRGTATFMRSGSFVLMTLDVSGISVNPGIEHGVHIHQFGDITSPTGQAAGPHYNPLNMTHGCPPSLERHLGDTGNWNVSSNGTIMESKELNLIELSGPLSIIGRALIIHSNTDDCMNETSSGQRIAQCVIGIANPTFTNSTSNNAAAFQPTNKSVCVLQPTMGNTANGIVVFEQLENGTVVVRARIEDLAPNSTHGFHIHQFGDIRSPTSTGAHWNPFNQTHSIPPALPSHLGDMGNVYYYEDGVAYYLHSFDSFQLMGVVRNPIGHAVALHASVDDCSDPAGNSGPRIAQCVIGYANPATDLALGESVPSFQDTSRCATLRS